MKKGINMWSFPKEWSVEKIFEEAKRAGFDGVEVAISEDGAISLTSTEEDMKKIRELAEKLDMEIISVASGFGWKYPLTDNDEEVRIKAKNCIKKTIEVAAWLGCDAILVVPGKVTPEVSYDVAYDRTVEALNELEAFAREKGVCIGVENVWNDFLLSPLEMRNLIDEINSPYVKAYLDVGNMIYSGFAQHWVRILGERIKKVHIKDYSRSAHTFVSLLNGDVNYPEVVKALNEVGYTDYLTAEVGLLKGHPELGLKNVASCIEAILK